MSYSLQTTCWNCAKRVTCTDEKTIQEAINTIHMRTQETGHQGSGTIMILCANHTHAATVGVQG